MILLVLPIALEAQVVPTNEWVNFWSDSSVVNFKVFPAGAVVQAYDPQGVLCGEFVVADTGMYGLMPVYKDDPTTPTVDEGAESGDTISFRIDGVTVSASGPDVPVWSSNGDVRRVNLIREQVIPTSECVNFWGDSCVVEEFEVPVPVDAVVRAYDSQGALCGEFKVTAAGTYGSMPVYRDDPSTMIDEGAAPGGLISFEINGVPALSTGPDSPTWTTNGDLRKVNLLAGRETATLLQNYLTSLKGTAVEIRWKLSEVSEAAVFYVMRAEAPGREFRKLAGSGIIRDGLSFSYRDESCEPGVSYRYRVDVYDKEGQRNLFETYIEIPSMFLNLYQNHPNPFNPATTISYYLPVEGRVVLDIYDVSGKRVSCLVDEYQAKGPHAIEWKGRNERGVDVASGVYFYRMRVGKNCVTRKMALLK